MNPLRNTEDSTLAKLLREIFFCYASAGQKLGLNNNVLFVNDLRKLLCNIFVAAGLYPVLVNPILLKFLGLLDEPQHEQQQRSLFVL
ncbi:hypothetical protein SAMN06295970_105212 [Noviherbaspirillum suwonense]|uniref:Uncharacterized protein n=1 Tax=Noviherbaspirillum suwonense TaxID=1224511 RepID=A0ABY1Q3E3_9BURK|nr:hypothetical protein SAMN06295970_105212 [Noviherbaspirillum suwonense]